MIVMTPSGTCTFVCMSTYALHEVPCVQVTHIIVQVCMSLHWCTLSHVDHDIFKCWLSICSMCIFIYHLPVCVCISIPFDGCAHLYTACVMSGICMFISYHLRSVHSFQS